MSLACKTSFRRGDSNADGTFNIGDVVFILQYLFANGSKPPCRDAADANDDGTVDLSDGIYVLLVLFDTGPAVPSPHPGCGTDPTVDGQGCQEYAPCPQE